MKYIDEYRDPDRASALARRIAEFSPPQPLTFMEVCGTHTMAIARFGIKQLLPQNIRLISGPGCPVCVTDNSYLDRAIAIAKLPNTIIATFGDMMRVPASSSNLSRCRSEGADIRAVTSTIEALEIAHKNPDREIIFLGVGFETTTPTVAASIKIARDKNINNYSALCSHKLVVPALKALLQMRSRPKSKPGSGLLQKKNRDLTPTKIDGFILPGHVSAIIGSDAYAPLLKNYKFAAAVAGFEPTDILEALLDMVEQLIEGKNRGRASSLNQNRDMTPRITYSRAVSPNGNAKAISLMNDIFEPCDAIWRGIGVIPDSGLKIRDKFSQFDATKKFDVNVEPTREHLACRCGEILQGLIEPSECTLFRKTCTPDNPVGACMVSSEGTCSAYYKYGV